MSTRWFAWPLVWLTAIAAAPAQSAFPAPDADPAGRVVDTKGAPIVGATITVEAHGDLTYVPATLPNTRSGKDGHFVLPLTPELRALGTGDGARIELVVRGNGYGPWREVLGQGLLGYLGSRVVLRALAADDPLASLPWPPALPPGQTLARPGAPEPPPAPASRPGGEPGMLQLSVLDERGAPAPGVVIRLPRGLVSVTDANGGVVFADVPPGELRVLASGAGFLPADLSVRIPSGELAAARMRVRTAAWVRLRTVGREPERGAIPFVALQATPRTLLGPGQSRHVLSDSEGRLQVQVDPEGPTAFIQAHLQTAAPPTAIRPGQVGEVLVDRPLRALLRAGAPVELESWTGRDLASVARTVLSATASLPRGPGAAADTWFFCGPARESGEYWLWATAGAPLRIVCTALPAPVVPEFEVVVLDRRPLRRIRLRVQAPDGKPVQELRVIPVAEGLRATAGTTLAERQPDGAWFLVLRDDGEYRAKAESGTLRSAVFRIPARAGDQPEAEVQLVLEQPEVRDR